MEFLKVAFFLIVGGGVLTKGADVFVQAASHLAKRMGISPLIIGLTIVSIGTSAPEFSVNMLAAIQGNADIALGNVVGSNIFNVAFIIGVCAIIIPLSISHQLIRIDIPIMVLVSALTLWAAYDGNISQVESLSFALMFVAYLGLQVYLAKRERHLKKDEFDKEFSDQGNLKIDALKLVLGLVLLVAGAKLFVEGAVISARFFGISEAVIALTIVSIGTSLPEVATSIAASMKGERDIAVGNVIGSNIFNILGVLGLSGSVLPQGLSVNPHMLRLDIPLMLVVAAVCMPLAFWRRHFERPAGVVFVLGYVAYLTVLIAQSV